MFLLGGCTTDVLYNGDVDVVPLGGVDPEAGVGQLTVHSLLELPPGGSLQLRLNGRDLVIESEPGRYQYRRIESTDASSSDSVPAGAYIVELIEPDGDTVVATDPLLVPPADPAAPVHQPIALVQVHGRYQAPQLFISELGVDDDPTTYEVRVRNASAHPVRLQRCVLAADRADDTCTELAIVAAGGLWTSTVTTTAVSGLELGGAELRWSLADGSLPPQYVASLNAQLDAQSVDVGCQTIALLIHAPADGGGDAVAENACVFW